MNVGKRTWPAHAAVERTGRGSGPVRDLSAPSGQSLIQLVIGVAIMGIVMMAMSSLIFDLTREVKALSRKLGIIELEKTMIAAMADGSVCKYVMNHPTPLTFDSTALPQTITLPEPSPGVAPALYASILPGPAPGPTIVEVGASVSALAMAIKVESIQLQITSGGSGSYLGNWIVNLTDGSGNPVKPATVSASLTVDDRTDPTQAIISDCSSEVFPSVPLSITYYRFSWDQTNSCRRSPVGFTKSYRGVLPSAGDIMIEFSDAAYSSALFEMKIRAPAAVAVTQYLSEMNDEVYFWLNDVKIAEEIGAGWRGRTITWNLRAGENVIQIVANNCAGGYESLFLIGDFFSRYPQLEFMPFTELTP